MLLKESVDCKINNSIWFCCMKEKNKIKGMARHRGITLFSEPHKAHLTSEFILVSLNDGHVLLLWSLALQL